MTLSPPSDPELGAHIKRLEMLSPRQVLAYLEADVRADDWGPVSRQWLESGESGRAEVFGVWASLHAPYFLPSVVQIFLDRMSAADLSRVLDAMKSNGLVLAPDAGSPGPGRSTLSTSHPFAHLAYRATTFSRPDLADVAIRAAPDSPRAASEMLEHSKIRSESHILDTTLFALARGVCTDQCLSAFVHRVLHDVIHIEFFSQMISCKDLLSQACALGRLDFLEAFEACIPGFDADCRRVLREEGLIDHLEIQVALARTRAEVGASKGPLLKSP